MSARSGLRFLGSRAKTFGLYLLAIIGASAWDDKPNSWTSIIFHLTATTAFLWWAVARTVRHVAEDRADDEAKP